MKVLIVASGNSNSKSPFILDQVKELKRSKIEIEFFLIKGKGLVGYLKNYQLLLNKIGLYKPDIIHAHYGLSGLLSVLQRKTPTVITFHGSDINDSKVRKFSIIANKLSSKSIFVSQDLASKLGQKFPVVIPCGVDMDVFYPMDKAEARLKLGLSLRKIYILFSSSFSNNVKNYPLAKEAIAKLEMNDVKLLELKGYTRAEVAMLMNAVDVALLTSYTEGSPQFIKEAMATNTPIVSVNVGDVKEVIKNTENCHLSKFDSGNIAILIESILLNKNRTNGRNKIKLMDNRLIANQIIEIYNSILI